MLKLSLINNILPTMPCLPALRYFKVEFLRYCFAACALCYFFFKLLYLSPGGSYLSRNQHSFTHSPAAINLTPTFCRIFLLANHSLLQCSYLSTCMIPLNTVSVSKYTLLHIFTQFGQFTM